MKKIVTILLLLLAFISTEIFALTKDIITGLFSSPERSLALIITDNGFVPDRLVASVGEELNLYITNISSNQSCFIMDKTEVFKGIPRKQLVQLTMELHSSGEFIFYCPSQNFQGKLIVLSEETTIKKKLVSDDAKSGDFWMPEDD